MDRVFGVHSEVGKLRTVMVCHDLLFDDVIWVQEARKDHFDFVLKMRDRGIEVLDFSELLGEAMEDKEARRFVLQRRRGPGHAVPQ